MRKDGKGEGQEGAPGNDSDPDQPGKGDPLDAQADPTGSGIGGSGKGTTDVLGVAGEGDPDIDAYGEREELTDAERVKAINIFEEMLAEEQNSGNQAIRQLQRHQTERAKKARDVERKMQEEAAEAADSLSDVFGNEPGTQLSQALRDQLEQGGEQYEIHRNKLLPEIRSLRTYARSVLQDNARRRWGGGYDSGNHIRKTRLFKPALDQFDVFQRRTEIGGRSYSIAVVVDQSGSMASYSNQDQSKQALAFRASLVFLEAFDGLARTALIGFTDFPSNVTNARRRSRYRLAPGGYMPSRTYKTVDQSLAQRKFTVPMLRESVGSTPMGAGIKAGVANLRKEQTEVRAIVLITDGYPSDGPEAERQAQDAKRAGIPIYSILVSDYIGREQRAEEFLSKISERVVPISSPSDIPPSVYRLLRGIVRRGGSVQRF
jgi:Mg-chelatase subunit ChlD